MSSLCEFVSGSAARSAIVCELSDGPVATAALIDAAPASESSVYAALTDLERRQLIEQPGDEWRLTGRGVIVADVLDAREEIERVLSTGTDYWQAHDPTALPTWARRGMWALDGCEIVRSPETDPARVVREVSHRIRTADRVDIVAPVYHDRFSEAVAVREGNTRLVLTEQLVEGLADTEGTEVDLSAVDVRIGRARFALAVTESCTLLSLPHADGGYDAETEVIAETDAAVDWGQRLFEHVWKDGADVEP